MHKKFLVILLSFILFSGYTQSIEDLLNTADELHNSNPDSSYYNCIKAEELAYKSGDEIQQGYCKLCKVRYYLLKNELEKAANELEKASELFSRNDSKKGLASTYLSMANIAGRIKKDQEEIEYIEKANKIFTELKDTIYILKSLTNLSLNYTHLGLLDKAEKALIDIEKYSLGMPEKEFYYLNQNWGILYLEKKEYDSALRRYYTAKSIAENLSMTDSRATINLLISELFIEIKKYDKALDAINESIRISVENGLIYEELEALQVANSLYEINGETDKAYQTYKKLTEIKDTIFNLQKVNKLNDYEKKIALAEKEKVIVSQKYDLEKNKIQLIKDKYEFYILVFVLVLISISVIYLIISVKNKHKANNIISKQKEEVEIQKKIVDDKNFQIMSSITYAKRIQEAILPQDKLVKEHLENSFILYKPKDIVSGDFYWMEQIDADTILFSVVDCTGHGVPGAFMSIVGNNGLNKAVRELKLTKPSHILDALNFNVINSLHLNSSDVKDGMDIAVCSLNLKTNKLQYSGAFNPLYIVRNGSEDVEITKADKQAVGSAKDIFVNHEIQLNKGDSLYIFTDGYADQFGGEKGKKFSYKQFRNLISSIQDLNMNQQRDVLNQKFHLWSQNEEQVDDICIIGVKI